MNTDTELDLWRQNWQSETPATPDLRTKVARQSRSMKLVLIAQVLVTLLIGGGTIIRAVLSPQRDAVLLAAATWVFLLAAWTFSLTANRGNWSPSALDAAAFLDLSLRRCRARLSAIGFAGGLYLCEIAFCLGWVYADSGQHRRSFWMWLFSGTPAMDFVWLVTLAFFAFLFWLRRRKRAELLQLLRWKIPDEDRKSSAEKRVPHWVHNARALRLSRRRRKREA